MRKPINSRHDAHAPYWAAALALFLMAGLISTWLDLGKFLNGYLLDIVGPAWCYILFRGLFTSYRSNGWTRFFTPVKTFMILFGVCLLIETLQYFELYDSTFDPWDIVAYGSLLIPLFLLDMKLLFSHWSSVIHLKTSPPSH